MVCYWLVFEVGLKFALCEYVHSGRESLTAGIGFTLQLETPVYRCLQCRYPQVSRYLSAYLVKVHGAMPREPLSGTAHARAGTYPGPAASLPGHTPLPVLSRSPLASETA